MSLENMKEMVAGLVLVALIIAALALALNEFEDDGITKCDYIGGSDIGTYNSTSAKCYNASNIAQAECSTCFTAEYNVTQEGLTGTANASGYLSTIGTLIGVGALISVVVGAFYLVRR